MKCPVCNDKDLVMADRQGVEIDYCPSCRGIWLDRGELDKLIDRSGEEFSHNNKSKQHHSGHHDYQHHKQSHQYKKKSIWGEIFDF